MSDDCRLCRGPHSRKPDLTPEQRRAQRAGRLDMFCTRCGHASAASAFCFQSCHKWLGGEPGEIIYVTHAEQAGWPGALLCGAPNRQGTRPGTSPLRPVPSAGTAEDSSKRATA